MVFGSKIVKAIYDVLRCVNVTLWDSGEKAKKIIEIIRISFSEIDVVIDTNHIM